MKKIALALLFSCLLTACTSSAPKTPVQPQQPVASSSQPSPQSDVPSPRSENAVAEVETSNKVEGEYEIFEHEWNDVKFRITLPIGLYPEADGIHQNTAIVPSDIIDYDSMGDTLHVTKICWLTKDLIDKNENGYFYQEYEESDYAYEFSQDTSGLPGTYTEWGNYLVLVDEEHTYYFNPNNNFAFCFFNFGNYEATRAYYDPIMTTVEFL